MCSTEDGRLPAPAGACSPLLTMVRNKTIINLFAIFASFPIACSGADKRVRKDLRFFCFRTEEQRTAEAFDAWSARRFVVFVFGYRIWGASRRFALIFNPID